MPIRPRTRWTALIALITAAILASATVTATTSAVAATGDKWSEPVSSNGITARNTNGKNPTCANFLFVGVRGSNQHVNLGPEEDAIRNAIRAQMAAAKYFPTVRSVYIDYDAADVSNLLTQAGRTKFFDSAFDGSTPTLTVLTDSLLRCPNEKWIVSGYSQGAIVVDRVLALLTPRVDRLAGVFTVGDPDNYPNRAVQKIGSASNRFARGAYDYFIDRQPAHDAYKPVAYSYCDALDAACDTNEVLTLAALVPGPVAAAVLARAAQVHSGYVPKLPAAVAPLVSSLVRIPIPSTATPPPSSSPSPTSSPSATPTRPNPSSSPSPSGSIPTPDPSPTALEPVAPVPLTTTPGVIADPGLADCVKARLQQEDLPVPAIPTTDDIAKLDWVACNPSTPIADTGQLAYATRASWVAFFAKPGVLIDLTPIARLTQLPQLTITGPTTDPSVLLNLKKLTSLTLVRGNILDASPLGSIATTAQVTIQDQLFAARTAKVGETVELPDVTGFKANDLTWTTESRSQVQAVFPDSKHVRFDSAGTSTIRYNELVATKNGSYSQVTSTVYYVITG